MRVTAHVSRCGRLGGLKVMRGCGQVIYVNVRASCDCSRTKDLGHRRYATSQGCHAIGISSGTPDRVLSDPRFDGIPLDKQNFRAWPN